KIEFALCGNNVECSPPLDQAGLYRRIRGIESIVVKRGMSQVAGDIAEMADQLCGILDSIDALRSVSGMAGCAMDFAAHGQLAFMPQHRLQGGGLAYKAQGRFIAAL